MTPQEKEALAYQLTPEDFDQLLQDTTSFEYKREIAREQAAAEEKAYLIRLFCLVELAAIKELNKIEKERVESAKKEDELYEEFETLYQQNSAELKPVLQETTGEIKTNAEARSAELYVEINKLLAVPTEAMQRMSAPQLQAHHQAIVSNIQDQALTQLIIKHGPAIAFDRADGVPGQVLVLPSVPAPQQHPTAAQVLQYHKGLADKVVADHEMQKAFATFHTQNELGPVGVLKTVRHILDSNNVSDLHITHRKQLMKFVDAVHFAVKMQHKTLPERLTQTNSLGLELFVKTYGNKTSVSKPPALYGRTQSQRQEADINENTNKNKPKF